jgi:hypothetical protein
MTMSSAEVRHSELDFRHTQAIGMFLGAQTQMALPYTTSGPSFCASPQRTSAARISLVMTWDAMMQNIYPDFMVLCR